MTREEWIEQHKQDRVAEGISLANQEMIQALAQQVVADRLARAEMGESSDKGRCTFIWHGEPTEAERMWSQLHATV